MHDTAQDTAPAPQRTPQPRTDYSDAALTEAADLLDAQARELREQAAAKVADMEKELAEARASAASLERDLLNAAGLAADSRARAIEQRRDAYRGAVRLRAQAAEAAALAAALQAEADTLTEQDQAYADRAEQVTAQRTQAQSDLHAAREAGDVASIAAATATISACQQAADTLDAQRRTVRDRLTEIGAPLGPGQPLGPGMPLQRALILAGSRRHDAERALDQIDPHRPSAASARQREIAQRVLQPVAAGAAADRAQGAKRNVVNQRGARR